jgi:tRNA nucleotidyltransferase/poly(A) polymerase
MKLSELLYAIDRIAEDRGLSQPYIVGGLARDKVLNRIEMIDDVDLTTGDTGIHDLAQELATKLGTHGFYKAMPDGHSSIKIGGLKLDFSSNFKIPGIVKILERAGIENPSEMQKELYSRDFTCNTALMTLDLKTVSDPTGLAIEDIEARILRTCLPAEITLGYDNKRIIRVIYMAAKLDFDIDEEIVDWVRKNGALVKNSHIGYLSKKINSSMEINPEKTVEVIGQLDLWDHLPAVPSLAPYMIKNRL